MLLQSILFLAVWVQLLLLRFSDSLPRGVAGISGLEVANLSSRAVLVLLFLRENFVVVAADDCADGGVVVVVDDGTDSAFVVYLCSLCLLAEGAADGDHNLLLM
jgi:hypothetical protein